MNYKEKNYLGRSMETADVKAQYDTYAKRIISDRTILSWIAKYTIKELKDYSIEEIRNCIEGEPEVATMPVYPGFVKRKVSGNARTLEDLGRVETTSDRRHETAAVTGISTEDNVPNEGVVTYDVRFYLLVPSGERIKIIVNIELQKNFYPGYDLVTRALFYCARMLSAQLDTEFTADNYDNIKKVYSIWICMNAPDYLADTITNYSIKPENIVGEMKGNPRYDLMSAVMICVNGESYLKKESPLHGLLGTIFSEELNYQEKENILNQEYQIETTKAVKEGMSRMCNLSDAIEERGIMKGLERGLEIGEVNKLIEQICRKMQKNKDVSTIAEELEEEPAVIQRIYDAVLKTAPDYDKQKISDFLRMS